MIVAETLFIASVLCTLPKKPSTKQDFTYIADGPCVCKVFQMFSGTTLETSMTLDLTGMPGVHSVSVKRTGDDFEVFVVMENLDFKPFDAVVKKELELYERYPQFTFNFDLMPVAAIEGAIESALHAA